MKELGITKGEWRIDTADAIKIKAEDGSNIAILTHLTNFMRRDTNEVERNALLIADAGNTAQKCGLLPSELLQQRDELKEALAEMIWQFGYRSTYEGRESLHTGGLSALESAFGALGLSDPIALLDFEAAIKNTEQK